MSVNTEKIKRLLYEALQRRSSEDRDAFLQQHCGSEPELKEIVESLVVAHEEAGDYLEKPAVAVRDSEAFEPEGATIGRYKLLEQIGEGGFGVVFMAEQAEPIRRRVALKIIKAGMDTKQVIARFEAERQALALMDHPNIAKVLDAGTTDPRCLQSEIGNRQSEIAHARPYFVMELVRGIAITKFCEENQLTVKERIELFIPVCQAIQHAHQKGVIHRDIKPSNVLVTLHEGMPHPMVIDFGVAKAINQRLTEKTLFTNFAQMIGTPAYMSPEQAEMSRQDVDTRTDVYSLGILLYELLTGTTPFPEERLKEVGYAEIQRIISQEEPVRPSTVLNRLNGRSRTIAANRNCEPAALLKLIKGDLDWIVLKAIDKDRNRRYPTPLELVADLERHLTNEPVTARPPSTTYRMQKFVRRNRVAVTAAFGITLVAVIGLVGIVWQMVEARTERANAEATLQFVRNDLLRQLDPFLSDPDRPPDRTLTLKSAVQIAAQGIEGRYRNQPQNEADIRLTIGNALRNLGENQAAEPHLRAAWEILQSERGAADAKTLEAGLAVARLLVNQSKFDAAADLSAETLEACERTLGPNHDLTLQAMNCLAHAYGQGSQDRKALEVFQESLERAKRSASPNPMTILSSLRGLTLAHYELGNFEERSRLIHEIHDSARELLGPNHPWTLASAVAVVNDLRGGQPQKAAQRAEEIYPRCLNVLGEGHPTTIYLLSEMARLEQAKGMGWVPLQRQVLEIAERGLGPDHPQTIFEKLWLGKALQDAGYLKEAGSYMFDAMERIHRLEGTDTLMSRRAMHWSFGLRLAQDRFEDAERLLRQCVQAHERALGPEAPWTHAGYFAQINFYGRQGKWSECVGAWKLLPKLLSSYPSSLGASQRHCASGLVAGCLANDLEATRSFAADALERLALDSSPEVAFAVSEALLLVRDAVPDRVRALDLASGAARAQPDPTKRALISALAAIRRIDWSQTRSGSEDARTGTQFLTSAVSDLRALTKHSDAVTACTSGFLLAIVYVHQGLTREAEEMVAASNQKFERLLRIGDLGHTSTYIRDEWLPVASAMVAQREVEMLVFGRQISPEINAAYLAEAQASWRPVKELLNKAEWKARKRQWAEAKQIMMQATSHEYFSWEAALHDDSTLRVKLFVLFALTEDWARYVELGRSVVRSADFGSLEWAEATLLVSHPTIPGMSNELAALADMVAERANGAEALSTTELLTLGIAQYRCGLYSQARRSLHLPQEAFNLITAGTANAYASMSNWMLRDQSAARDTIQIAQDQFQQIQEGNTEDLGEEWWRHGLFELALKEADRLLTDDQ